MNMKRLASFIKLFSDVTRLRILMLLGRSELCVCQIMAVLGVSQPLVSRNLSMLESAGLLEERRSGKLVFYSLRKNIAEPGATLIKVARAELKDDEIFVLDLSALSDCNEYMKRAGESCDMKAFLAYMKNRRERKRKPQQAA